MKLSSLCKKFLAYNQKIMNYFVDKSSIVDEWANIWEWSKIWHFSHIMWWAIIGKNCGIGQNVFVWSKAIVWNNCKIQNNVSIYDGVTLEDWVFCGPSCVFTNDINPRAEFPKNGEYISTLIKKWASIWANVTLVCGITVWEYSFIAAGAVVTKDVPPYTLVAWVPAKAIWTVDKEWNYTLFKKNK